MLHSHAHGGVSHTFVSLLVPCVLTFLRLMSQIQAGRCSRHESNEAPRDVEHAQLGRRIFIGPIPHRRLTTLNEEDEEQVTAFVRQHGLKLFLKSGGRIEDWTEGKAKEYKDRLLDYLEHSVWHTHSKKKKKKGMVNPIAIDWSGDTFEIGKVVGVNINMLAIPEEEPQASQATASAMDSADLPRPTQSALAVHWDVTTRSSVLSTRTSLRSPKSSSKAPTSFVTAPESLAVTSKAEIEAFSVNESAEETSENLQNQSASSSTAIVSRIEAPSPGRTSSAHTPSNPLAHGSAGASTRLKSELKSILTNPSKQKKDKGKRRAVSIQEPSGNGGENPAPPEDVLRRSPEDVQDSSAAAAAEAISEAASEASSALSDSWSEIKYGDVIMRGALKHFLANFVYAC